MPSKSQKQTARPSTRTYHHKTKGNKEEKPNPQDEATRKEANKPGYGAGGRRRFLYGLSTSQQPEPKGVPTGVCHSVGQGKEEICLGDECGRKVVSTPQPDDSSSSSKLSAPLGPDWTRQPQFDS
ncbi:hypothetical protein XA68_17644 [Ophiocordyceps unilateralis]|uniref:Uncharacterized protein n=1 Tax=Ophiocordyceps unilateralis TaxID=268505 RepID=A0A2A9P4G4_OPHUN|nr:hypothetical protein XA68_17644 [Ophiocordyceps unilateralis]